MTQNTLTRGRVLPLASLLAVLFAVTLVGCSKETGAPPDTTSQKQLRQEKKD